VPVKVKICGVCRVEDARAAVAAGADFLGLNFHPQSPRCVTLARARAIADAVPGTALVGVFVDAARADVVRVVEALGLFAVQFHGAESAAYCRGWPCATIKAIRPRPDEDAAALAAGYATDYVLVDAYVPGTPGGTGVPLDPACAARLPRERLFVAGGLRPDTVAAVVRALQPFAVDVASGVEAEPGRKDHAKIEAFIRCARAA
jgi:phosphoribosylanthranilate isomerase